MRLKQIKLVGFKSFVDATTVPFKSNLTAIVGPNGCGKSNIIDAVRWVMGESSAKHLRGELMSDVIFSGSDSRKPVGQASIELIFDNSDGTIAGEYARYNELAIRRQVTRDGQSQYYLNGNHCRKKDITSIFLGTGLGPRSYAIIEQGIISRLIEAKPDELRVYLEEAAGVSKYKERRRETERRIGNTRDNLERLSDIREELSRQLAHLKRQANAAERFKVLKTEERQLKSELIALRWQGYQQELDDFQIKIQDLDVELAACNAEQQSFQTEIEKARVHSTELSDNFNEVQGRYYGVGAEIARLEQSIKHNQERRTQLEADLSRLDQSERSALEHITHDDKLLKEVSAEIATIEPELESLNTTLQAAQNNLDLAENSMQDWQADWNSYQESSAAVNQRVEVLQTQIQHAELLLGRGQSRLDQLTQEQKELSSQSDTGDLNAQREKVAQLQAEATQQSEEAEKSGKHISDLRTQRDQQQQELQQRQQSIQKLEGEEVKLTALQQASLQSDSEELDAWFAETGNDAERLTESMQVSQGWELAVETVLAGELNAINLNQSLANTELFEKLQNTQQSFYLNNTTDKTPNTLASVIEASFPLPSWLNHVQIVDSAKDALAGMSKLESYESIISRDGVWVGVDWLRTKAKAEDGDSVLEREQRLREISAELSEQRKAYSKLNENLEQLRSDIKTNETIWQEQQQQANDTNRAYAELNAEVSSQEARLTEDQIRLEKINQQISDIQKQIEQEKQTISDGRSNLEKTLASMQEQTEQREKLTSRRVTLQAELSDCREKARQSKENQQQSNIRLQSLKIKLATTETGRDRAEMQLSELGQRKEQLKAALAEEQTPIEDLQKQLQETLSKHQTVEKELAEARHELEVSEQSIRQLEAKRQQAEQKTQDCRSRLESQRMEWQAVKVRLANEEEQLAAAKQSAAKLLVEMEEGASIDDWIEKLEKMGNRIQRLGAINLAAIDEYDTQSERKEYMDQQIDDLNEALETLENAIRKIDKETTSRFRDTFDAVNAGLQKLFPKVFGGGHAYLEMTGDDLLSTGISVMARPPGKRNSSISALSGGEKALTAIALVFAIFQMNPSPFCMLDEVDAPLDEANLGRFCRLVEEMAESVQFIYITHRKVTIEMAQHLSGVTMHEPGVSRMVSVDLDEATTLAEAS